jgi:hypothetical protein
VPHQELTRLSRAVLSWSTWYVSRRRLFSCTKVEGSWARGVLFLFSYRCIDVCTVYSLQYAHTVLCSCSHLLRIHSIRILASITHSTFVLCSTSLQAMFSHDVGAQLVPRKSPLAPLPSCKEQSLSSILWAPLLPLGTTLPPSGSTLRAPETPGADANGAEPHFPEPSTFGSFLLPDSHPQTPNRSRSQWATSCLTLRAGLRPEQKPRIPPPPFRHYVRMYSIPGLAISEGLFR